MLSYPDYTRCPVNIVSSIRKYYREPNVYPTLPKLDAHLSKFYKNVVLIVLSGMGTDMMERNLPASSFLRRNFIENLTSVFPSSTAAATSFYTGVSPNEHGWLGKSLFFKEFCRTVDVFTNLDSYTKTPVASANAAEFVMPYETIYRDIADSIIGDVQPFTVTNEKTGISEKGNIHKTADTFERVCELLKMICMTNQNTFTYVYWNSPDDIAHRDGTAGEKTAAALKLISKQLEVLCKDLTDTVVIVTADHGMKDVSEEIKINYIPDIMECLVIPPFAESRAASCFVKNDRRTDFERAFHNHLGNDFILLSKNDIIAKGILGGGRPHPKIADFIGDYMICAIADKSVRYLTLNTKPKPPRAADHGGLTEEEMTVPLIIIPTKQTKEYKQKKLL
ncbi:MAG: alkaline phosphatase family protein [Prevotella sp.]|nr:alkaline phosphatase family protein [Prevotella sp.]